SGTCHGRRCVLAALRRFLSLVLTPRPPPPKSTLFPYTTLFRSRSRLRPLRRHVHHDGEHAVGHPGAAPGPHGDHPAVRLHRVREDRKSTRLNSSHVAISYAVFCLKKKKRKPPQRRRPTRARPTP